jgi:soluble cytochrome b562
MVDIMTALATAGQAIKLANDLRGIDKAMDAAEYKLKIAELTSALSDIKVALTEARDEIRSRDEEIKRLQGAMKRAADTVERKGFKYDKKDDGNPTGHAYCPVCEQKEGQFFHLASGPGRNEFCPHCKSVFGHVTVFT